MPQMKWLGPVGLAFLYCVFITMAVPAALGDDLFYRSDIFSMSVFLAAASLILFPIAALVAWGISHLPSMPASLMSRFAAYIAAIGIIDIFLALALLYAVGKLDWIWLTKLIKHPIIALAVCFLPAALVVFFHRDKTGLVRRVSHIGSLALLTAPLLIAYSIITSNKLPPSDKTPPGDGRHLTLIILDGWPTQLLHAYNPRVPASQFDQQLGDARIYMGAYTSAAWTSGYFGVLHNGNPRVAAGDVRKRPSAKSLAAELQDNGIGTRLMNFHRNGIPEGSNAHRNDHKGLRSYFLTEGYTWIPQELGLEYHVAISSPVIAQNLFNGYAKRLFYHVNPVSAQNHPNIFTGVLIPELRHLQQKHRSSFTMFHIGWQQLGKNTAADSRKLPGAQDTGEQDTGEKEGDEFPTDAVRRNDYQYDLKFENQVEQKRLLMQSLAHQNGAYLSDFLSTMRSDPQLAKTAIVLTADHGGMYGKGRVWYGFHPNREVIQVPFIVFDDASGGKDNRFFGTPALSKAILSFYDNTNKSRAFTPPGSDKGPVFSLTLKSDIHKEWFFVASYPDKAYWMNLHPQGSGETLQVQIDGYRETIIKRIIGLPSQLVAITPDALRSFGLQAKAIHPAFR